MDRRAFLKKAGVISAAAATTMAVVSYPGKPTHAQTRFKWRFATSFGITAPVLGTSLPAMAADMKVMTKGKVDIKVYGAGELVPAFGVYDAVRQGGIHMMYSASYYWAGKTPATPPRVNRGKANQAIITRGLTSTRRVTVPSGFSETSPR